MHEAAIARQLLRVVLEHASRAGAGAVRRVQGWVSEDEALSVESLSLHFSVAATGTLAEGARLDLRIHHVAARCRTCGAEYAPEHHVRLCPICGSAEADLLGPTGLGIVSLEIDEP